MAVTIQFTITPSPETGSVLLFGEWDSWKETALKRKKDGSWYARKKVPDGIWQFGFLCDGIWAVVPGYSTVPSPFGTENNRIEIRGES